MSDGARPEPGADPLVLGGDIGGTSTRFVVTDRHGHPVARGAAGGGNPVARPDTAVEAFTTALREAVAGIDPGRIRVAVVGLAGGGSLRGTLRAGFDAAWASAGIGCPASYCSDVEVAFASGTPEPDGAVLVAGTGAVAGVVEGGRLVRVADGHGWLLGDDGSGFWLGRQAVRAALRELEPGVGATTALTRAVLAHHGLAAGSTARDLVGACHDRTPVALAALAPVVLDLAAEDSAAGDLVDAAAGRLLDTLGRVRPDPGQPLVLAGGVLAPGSPVASRLRDRLAADPAGSWPARVEPAADGTRGAIRIGLRIVSEYDRNDA